MDGNRSKKKLEKCCDIIFKVQQNIVTATEDQNHILILKFKKKIYIEKCIYREWILRGENMTHTHKKIIIEKKLKTYSSFLVEK